MGRVVTDPATHWWEGECSVGGVSSPCSLSDWAGCPWDEWVYWYLKGDWIYRTPQGTGYVSVPHQLLEYGIVDGYYWIYRVSKTTAHESQIGIRVDDAFRRHLGATKGSDIDLSGVDIDILVFTKYDEPPALYWDADYIAVVSPCGNYQTVYASGAVHRSQTWQVAAAIGGDRELNYPEMDAAVAADFGLDYPEVHAAVQGNPTLDYPEMRAVVRGDTEKIVKARAAVTTDRELNYPEMDAAVAADFGLDYPEVHAAVQGNPTLDYPEMRAVVRGDAELTFQVDAIVMKDRTEAILIEMENLWPQEYANESVPNWPSKARHWGRDPLA